MFKTATVHATIGVKDLDRAMRFYGETLGLKVQDERSDGVTYQTGNTWFLVYPSQFAGTNKATYMSFEVENVEEAVQQLRNRGIVFEDYDFPGLKTVNGIAEIQGVKAAWFKDPDGNLIAVGERR